MVTRHQGHHKEPWQNIAKESRKFVIHNFVLRQVVGRDNEVDGYSG
jgi:hypothetical protein